MSILIGSLEFSNPVLDIESLRREGGLFAVFSTANGEDELIELAETEDIRGYFEFNKQKYIGGDSDLAVAVHYTGRLSQAIRRAMTRVLESEFELDAVA